MPTVHLIYREGRRGAIAQIETKTGRLLFEGTVRDAIAKLSQQPTWHVVPKPRKDGFPWES